MKRTNQGRTSSVPDYDEQAIIAKAVAAVMAGKPSPKGNDVSSEEVESTIDLVELFYHILGKIKYVIAAALIGAIVLGVYGVFFVTPMYQATAKLYIVGQDDSVVKLSDLQIGSMLTKDYQEVFKSWEVHEMVRQSLGLDFSYTEMDEMLSVTNPSETRILYISVTNPDRKLATQMANAYAEAAQRFILQTMDAKEPNVFSVALEPNRPIGHGKAFYIAVGLMLGTFLALAAIVLFFIMDDRPRTAEDVKKAAGIPTLATIPVSRESSTRRERSRLKGKE